MKYFINRNIIKSMVVKEFKQLLRDVKMRGVLFGAPIVMIILFGFAVNTDVTNINMAVLDEDKTAFSRSIIERFTASGYFNHFAYLKNGKELDTLIDSGEVEVFLRIERGLSKKINRDRKGSVQIIIDGANSSRAAVIVAYVNVIVSDVFFESFRDSFQRQVIRRLSNNSARALTPLGGQSPEMSNFRISGGIQLQERAFYNPELASRNFFLPGVVGLLVSLITIMLTSMSIVKEREIGTIEQIIVSPITSYEYILGKTIPFAIIGFVDMCVVTLVAIFFFGVPFNGNFLFLLCAGFLYILSTLAIGLYISTISVTQQQAMLSTFLFFMPAILLSGFIFPIYSMPEPIQALTLLNPLRYFMTIIRGVFLKGTGFTYLWVDISALVIIGLSLLYLSSKRFNKRFE